MYTHQTRIRHAIYTVVPVCTYITPMHIRRPIRTLQQAGKCTYTHGRTYAETRVKPVYTHTCTCIYDTNSVPIITAKTAHTHTHTHTHTQARTHAHPFEHTFPYVLILHAHTHTHTHTHTHKPNNVKPECPARGKIKMSPDSQVSVCCHPRIIFTHHCYLPLSVFRLGFSVRGLKDACIYRG